MSEVFKLMVKYQMNVKCPIEDRNSTSENVVLKHFPLCWDCAVAIMLLRIML
uniref:Uncharacterized protein n=1 Tax=Amphimedon queenslandica TaxID=400682 RepID=A0A1X7UIW5_AMPQE